MGVGSLFIVVTQGTRGMLPTRYNDSFSTYAFIISESRSGNMGEQRPAIKCSHPEGTHINKSFDVPWALPFLPEMVHLQLTCLSVFALWAQLSGSAPSWAGQDHHLLHLRDQHRHSTFRILRNASCHWLTLNKLFTLTSILLWAIDCEIKSLVFIPSKFHLAIFGPESKKKKKKDINMDI